MNKVYINFLLLITMFILGGCSPTQKGTATNLTNTDPYSPKKYVELKHPDWSKNATIYEVNIRQFTPEGTFKAFESHLPRLKELGVDVLWLMPVHPIGIEKRKGKIGSYYSVRDYYGVNPEFGTLEEFKSLVNRDPCYGNACNS